MIAGLAAGVPGALQALAATGVEQIAVTELDIGGAAPEEYTIDACLNITSCVGVTVWGVSDKVGLTLTYANGSHSSSEQLLISMTRTRGGPGKTPSSSTPNLTLSPPTMPS